MMNELGTIHWLLKVAIGQSGAMSVNFWLNVVMIVLLSIVAIFLIGRQKKLGNGSISSTMAYRMQLVMDAVQKATNGVIVTDNAFRIVFWNSGAEHLLGWREYETQNKLISMIGLDVIELIKKGTPIDTFVMNKRGNDIDVNVTISDSNINGVVHYTIIMKSIADRILIQRQHEQELSLYHNGESVGCVGFWSWDISSRTVRVTNGFKEIFETERDIEDVESLLRRIYYEDKKKVEEVLNNAIDEKKDYVIEYRVGRMSGEHQWVRSHGRVYTRDNGTVQMIAGIIIKIDKHGGSGQ